MIGFTNLGDINTHLLQFEQSLNEGSSNTDTLANSMLVFMVKGLFNSLQFPYAQFPCSAISGNLLYDPLWEAVRRLERCGFKVMAITCDGLAANRRFIKIHAPNVGLAEMVYKTPNPNARDKRDLYFISDPPHLLKTTRNCWASKNRALWVSTHTYICNIKKTVLNFTLPHFNTVQWKGDQLGTSGGII